VAELKEKGEDTLIKVNSDIGSINSSLRELDRISSLNKEEGIKLQKQRDEIEISKRNIESEKIKQENFDDNFLNKLNLQIDDFTLKQKLSRKKLSDAAGESGEFSKQSIKLNAELESIQNIINPLEVKKRKVEEETIQNNIQKDEISSQIDVLALEKQKLLERNQRKKETYDIKNNNLASNSSEINALTNEIDLLNKTKLRLNNEQLKLEKDLSRFESRKEALNESRGSYALRILLESGLEGIHGYVAQLGEVSEKNRYALEIAAGNRLGQIVVENDHIAAKAIEILKKKKAGRLTFLPLNRIRSQKKNFAIGLFLINLIVEPMPIWLRLLDPYVPIQIFPENGTDALWWTIITFLCIGYFLRTAGWILVISMVYDVVEDGQLATGRRDEGLYLSANGFIQKIISGLGVVFVGFLLEFVGFDVKNPTVIEMQEPIYRLAYFQAILGPILTLASISCMFFYNISKSSHEEALKSLEINKD